MFTRSREDAQRVDLEAVASATIDVVKRLNAVLAKQLLTYLRRTEQPLGLLINFGGATLKVSSTATTPLRLRVFA